MTLKRQICLYHCYHCVHLVHCPSHPPRQLFPLRHVSTSLTAPAFHKQLYTYFTVLSFFAGKVRLPRWLKKLLQSVGSLGTLELYSFLQASQPDLDQYLIYATVVAADVCIRLSVGWVAQKAWVYISSIVHAYAHRRPVPA